MGTPQPGFAREVGVPVLILLGAWLLAFATTMLWAYGLGGGQGPLSAVFLAGHVLLPLAFLLLFLRWAWRRRGVSPTGQAGQGVAAAPIGDSPGEAASCSADGEPSSARGATPAN